MKSSGDSATDLEIKKRLIVLFGTLFFIILLLIGRLGWIQAVDGQNLKKTAVEQWNSEVKIDAKRGKILDRNGRELAVSVSCKRVDVYMPDVTKAEKDNSDIKNEIASKIADVLGIKQEDILKKLNATLPNGLPINSATLVRRIDNALGDEIKKLHLPGIVVSEDNKRLYPNGSFLSQVLGFTDIDGRGQKGIEQTYEKELKGTPGSMNMETDVYGRELPFGMSEYSDPVDGDNIVLTIDESIHLYVEKALEGVMAEHKTKSATAIVMDPKTGEILAMASKPDFDPNNPRNMDNYENVQQMMQAWNNKGVTFTYEPGSVFKLVTAAAALGENIANDDTRFYDPGYLIVGGRRIYDWNRRASGILSFAEILQTSSNVGFMMLGEELGKDRLYKYIDDFGFGKKTGIDVSYEEAGYKIPINNVGPVELANISFGQGIVVTPMQMISAYAAIANQGKMMVPHLVKALNTTDQDGNIISIKEIQPEPSRQVVDTGIANKLMEYLETVVSVGGGRAAYVDGYRIAGKTGTAQKAENGSYVPDKYICTFVGMAPVDNPQFVVYISADEPDPSQYYASQVVAPAAGQIFRDLFSIRNIPPDTNNGQGTVPNVVGLTENDAVNRLKFSGFKVAVNGKGTAVKSTNPAPGTSLEPGSKVTLNMGNVENYSSKVIVPNIIGMKSGQAQSLLDSLGLKFKVSGQGTVSSQSPGAGNLVDIGSVVSIRAR